jgi:hypothetical protein
MFCWLFAYKDTNTFSYNQTITEKRHVAYRETAYLSQRNGMLLAEKRHISPGETLFLTIPTVKVFFILYLTNSRIL